MIGYTLILIITFLVLWGFKPFRHWVLRSYLNCKGLITSSTWERLYFLTEGDAYLLIIVDDNVLSNIMESFVKDMAKKFVQIQSNKKVLDEERQSLKDD